MQTHTLVVPAFVRRLMPTASENEIIEATQNLRDYLLILYRAFLGREEHQRTADSASQGPHGRVTAMRRMTASPMTSYVAYIRVSTAKQGQQGSSLQEQRDAILAFANRQQLHIAEWYEDRETAAKKGRTQFMRMMLTLEKQKAKGVILHKIDRGARNLWDWARIQDLIETGVEVHFAHDNLDLRSRGGRLAADIQAVVAADYVRNLRDEVRKGMRGRLKQGFYPLPAPIGYVDQGKAKPKTVDPIKGPLVKAAFELYATNQYSLRTLAVALQRGGLVRPGGGPLSANTIAGILHNPFYTGVIRLQTTGEVFQGVHEPLVDARTYQLVQTMLSGKHQTKVRRFDFIYRKLLTCGLCDRRLTGELQKGSVYYRCHTSGCATKGIREDAVYARLRQQTRMLVFTDEELKEMSAMLLHEEASQRRDDARAISALKLRIAAIEDRDRRLVDAYIDQALDKEAYNDRKSRLLLELAAVKEELRCAQTAHTDTYEVRVKKFFELLKTLELSPNLRSRADYRAAVEKVTSNRSVIRKKLVFTMRSPFQEVIKELSVTTGGPRRGRFRKCTPLSIASEKDSAQCRQALAKYRARVLIKHLANWHPEDVVPITRKPLPQWFKPKHSDGDTAPV